MNQNLIIKTHLLIVIIAFGGCSDNVVSEFVNPNNKSYTKLINEIDLNQKKWTDKNIQNYKYVLHSGGGDSLSPSSYITVINDQIDYSFNAYGPNNGSTVDEIFETIKTTILSNIKNDHTVTFDKEYGLPSARLFVDQESTHGDSFYSVALLEAVSNEVPINNDSIIQLEDAQLLWDGLNIKNYEFKLRFIFHPGRSHHPESSMIISDGLVESFDVSAYHSLKEAMTISDYFIFVKNVLVYFPEEIQEVEYHDTFGFPVSVKIYEDNDWYSSPINVSLFDFDAPEDEINYDNSDTAEQIDTD